MPACLVLSCAYVRCLCLCCVRCLCLCCFILSYSPMSCRLVLSCLFSSLSRLALVVPLHPPSLSLPSPLITIILETGTNPDTNTDPVPCCRFCQREIRFALREGFGLVWSCLVLSRLALSCFWYTVHLFSLSCFWHHGYSLVPARREYFPCHHFYIRTTPHLHSLPLSDFPSSLRLSIMC